MAIFIKQRQLGNKTSKDISQIAEFGSIAWDFICAIYESEWNNLKVNKKDGIF